MKYNVSNIPMNTLYKFDENKYVMALMLNLTRDNSYPMKESKRFTEVYQVDSDGLINRITSGSLIDNPQVYDFDKMFSIRDYDRDQIFSFKVNVPLQEVGLKELYKVRDLVNKSKMEKRR